MFIHSSSTLVFDDCIVYLIFGSAPLSRKCFLVVLMKWTKLINHLVPSTVACLNSVTFPIHFTSYTRVLGLCIFQLKNASEK